MKTILLLIICIPLYVSSCGKTINSLTDSDLHPPHEKTTFSLSKQELSRSENLPNMIQPFQIISPPSESVLLPDQNITIEWTGGDPSWHIDLQLVDITAYTVIFGVVMNIPNSGTFDWTLPSLDEYPFGGPFEHIYQFYIQNVERTMCTYGPVFTIACAIKVTIDIKPGSFYNSINPHSRGVIPVAILTTALFEATSVDPSSVNFGPDLASPLRFNFTDVNNDNKPDMIMHFKTNETGIDCGDVKASLTGKTFTGNLIKGFDAIRTVGCK